MKIRLLLVAIMTTSIMFLMVGQAWACSNACPPRQNCVHVCLPDLW